MKQTPRIFLAFSIVFLAACAETPDIPQGLETDDPRTLEQIYNTALDYLFEKDIYAAIGELSIIEIQYPYSEWARRAIILNAYAHYVNGSYEQTIASTRNFIGLYPGNPNVSYAYYLNAMAHFAQLDSVERDPKLAERALVAFNALIRLFPDTAYARDGQIKVRFLRAYGAEREMYLGRYYLRRRGYIGAINHFQNVVRRHQGTHYVQEALYRLSELYITLGLTDEAKRWAAILGHNFPDDPWYKRAYRLLSRIERRKS